MERWKDGKYKVSENYSLANQYLETAFSSEIENIN
jgi:hypothetical protein